MRCLNAHVLALNARDAAQVMAGIAQVIACGRECDFCLDKKNRPGRAGPVFPAKRAALFPKGLALSAGVGSPPHFVPEPL
jgi:hypothetical protein